MSDVVIHQARLYDIAAGAVFLGQRSRVYDRIVRHSRARPGERVLDLGTGTAYLARRMAAAVRPGGRVTGIDPSATMVRFAQRRVAADAEFRVARAQELPFDDGSFDLVVSCLAFHHVTPDDRPLALAEAYRVLAPDGRLMLADLRPPRNLVVKKVFRHGLESNPVDDDQVTAAGFELVARDESWPLLQLMLARRI
ncbi:MULTISPECIES: class I SAM-dependent methyltransferase [Kribbella]|uniref:Methyltransferase domain-containing protein n=1 Tax=Kribbella karoonensis TaxID=324851 RepID=A0ABN2DKT4_9ACTN